MELTPTAGEFDGFTTLFAADSDVIDVTGTSVDSSNVIAEMGKVVDAIPSAIYGKEDLKLYVSKNVMKAYVRALGGFGASRFRCCWYRQQRNTVV